MPRWIPVLLLALLASPAFAQLSPDKALATMKPADGLQVELFAAEPMLLNPTAIDVDHLGRVWVAEAVNYRRKNFGRPIIREAGDRIVILTDKDGDGKSDDSTVFYQGKDLYGPLGVCVLASPGRKSGEFSYRVLVAQSPDILEFTDADGDGKADGPPKKFLTGFGGFDHDHGVHGLSVGPDGKLYFTVGDSGVTGLQSSDGKGPKYVSNSTTIQKGTVWRCDLDGKNVELIAHNFRNNYECCVNSFGEIWLSDNDDDGNQQTRICHVMPGGNYGYGPRGPGQTHWHEEQPGIVHKTLRTGFGSPTGICFYEGNLLDKKYQGQLFHCDAGPREVRCFHIKPKGAGYELDKEVILTSSDNFFRPSAVRVAPDGSVFVADWYDRGVGGHGMGDPNDGRIYRLTPKGHKGYKVPEVKLDTKEGIVASLQLPNLAARYSAMAALRTLSTFKSNVILYDAMFKYKDSPGFFMMASMHLQGAPRAEDISQIEKELNLAPGTFIDRQMPIAINHIKNSAAFRAADVRNIPFVAQKYAATGAVNYLDQLRDMIESSIAQESKHKFDSPAVYRECLIQLQHCNANVEMRKLFYYLADRYDGQDIFYRAALNIACGTDPERRDRILADFEKHFPEWNDKVADLVWELRPKSMLPKMESLLKDGKLSAMQKARIVDILAANDDPAAGKTMLNLLQGDASAEVKTRAIDNLKLFLPTKWNALGKSEELRTIVATLLGDAKSAATGLQLIAAANYAAALDDVIRVAGNGTLPVEVRIEAIRTLGKLPGIASVEAIIAMGTPENPLSIACIQALGNLLPNGPKPAAGSDKALAALQQAVNSAKASNELKSAALAALAGNRAGTGWLLKLKEDGKMPESLQAEAGRLLRNSPFQGERNKALLLFPAPGKLVVSKLPAIPDLAKRKGNVENGKTILAKSVSNEVQCLKCHTIRGTGGQIGPDLSMIGKKGSRENLFESILYPAKAIADQYVNWKLDTEDGQSLTGLLVQETASSYTLRDANGKDYTVPVKGTEKKKLPNSLMADNLVGGLTEDELVDVVEYLTTLQTASLTPGSWQIAGPFPGTLDTEHRIESAGTDFGKWKPLNAGAGNYFDLAALHGNAANNSFSYALREIDSPEDQEATVLLGTDDGGKLFVNGTLVFTSRETRAAAPEQNRVTVKLKKGTNAILLKVANGNNPHGFYLTVTSGQELKMK